MNRRTMMTTLAGSAVVAGLAEHADGAQAAPGALPVASAPAAKDFPGAKERPIPATDYKVVFSVGAPADRRMGIAGEDLEGSFAATAFVGYLERKLGEVYGL